MKCRCGKRVTQLWPTSLCDTCWAEDYSKQWYGGKLWGFKHLFKALLLEKVLFMKDDETKEQWYQRCKEKALTSKLLGGNIHGKKTKAA